MWAFSQAPVIYKNLVIIAVQGVEAGVVAYHADTGKIVWKTPRLCEDYGYASPVLTTIDGVDQVIQVTPYVSPDYVEEEEEDEDEEEPVPSVPLTVLQLRLMAIPIRWFLKPRKPFMFPGAKPGRDMKAGIGRMVKESLLILIFWAWQGSMMGTFLASWKWKSSKPMKKMKKTRRTKTRRTRMKKMKRTRMKVRSLREGAFTESMLKPEKFYGIIKDSIVVFPFHLSPF
jgi:hypothetical protein